MIEVKDQQVINIPEKTYQDSQKTTEKLTQQARQLGQLESENEELKAKLKRDAKEITITLEKGSPARLYDMFYGANPGQSQGKLESIMNAMNFKRNMKYLKVN